MQRLQLSVHAAITVTGHRRHVPPAHSLASSFTQPLSGLLRIHFQMQTREKNKRRCATDDRRCNGQRQHVHPAELRTSSITG
jgi:hypothetical protein